MKKILDKELISENLRVFMTHNKLSLQDVVSSTGLSRAIVDNIYYCRAVTFDTLKTISEAYEIDIDTFFKKNISYTKKKDFNSDKYCEIVSIINKVAKNLDLKINKHILINTADIIYMNYEKFSNYEDACKSILLHKCQ